ncbi:hypothetical protein FA95DRAFT_1601845 [Auriscalpium vulgare]|uniref:Uncharacterized protein n=1 Tax=Auriscalpium vulgare TaxID=40419 RepID=A0ACB8S7J9_9AGAM|nr:hypothetical protein FA95DRAFT_1601845 [Auriscalpium vulgare]
MKRTTTDRASYDEKRHTKPCKFYQKGTCPLSAEQCNFAHVRVVLAPTKPAAHLVSAHGHAPAWPTKPHHAAPRFEVAALEDGAVIASPCKPSLNDRSLYRPVAQPPPQRYADPVSHWPVPHPYPPYGDPLYHGVAAPSPVYAHPALTLPSAPSHSPAPLSNDSVFSMILRDSGALSPSCSSVSSSPASADSALLVDGEGHFTSHGTGQKPQPFVGAPSGSYSPGDWVGSPATPTDGGGYYIPPGMFSPGVPYTPNIYGYFGPVTPATPAPAQPKSKAPRKAKAFRTKPCKHFRKDGRCPQGNKCTFIHDTEHLHSRSVSPSSPGTPQSASSASSHAVSLPEKPRSAIEEKRARGIYPITWRVVSGGVMMGGQRQVCRAFIQGNCPDGDDCALAHPDKGKNHEQQYDALPTPPPSARADAYLISPGATPRAASFAPEQLVLPGPSSLSPHANTHTRQQLSITIPTDSAVLPSIRRAAALSRPHSTPPRVYGRSAGAGLPPVRNDHVYSAESPAA